MTKRYFCAGIQEVAGDATTNLFYSQDHLGSVREVSDANGDLVARYDYDPWGRRSQTFGDLKTDYGYAGYFIHQASGLNLTWFRAYDPDLGRWVSRDPIGEDGGANLYGYVGNNPVNFNDPNGLQAEALAIGWGIALAEPTPFGEIAMLGVTAVVGIGIGISYLASRPAPQSATPAPPASSAKPKEQEKTEEKCKPKPERRKGKVTCLVRCNIEMMSNAHSDCPSTIEGIGVGNNRREAEYLGEIAAKANFRTLAAGRKLNCRPRHCHAIKCW